MVMRWSYTKPHGRPSLPPVYTTCWMSQATRPDLTKRVQQRMQLMWHMWGVSASGHLPGGILSIRRQGCSCALCWFWLLIDDYLSAFSGQVQQCKSEGLVAIFLSRKKTISLKQQVYKQALSQAKQVNNVLHLSGRAFSGSNFGDYNYPSMVVQAW